MTRPLDDELISYNALAVRDALKEVELTIGTASVALLAATMPLDRNRPVEDTRTDVEAAIDGAWSLWRVAWERRPIQT